MYPSTFPHEVIAFDEFVQTARDEGDFTPFTPSVPEEFSALIAQFSSALRLLPSGELREDFNSCLLRIEYLRLRVETDFRPLPF